VNKEQDNLFINQFDNARLFHVGDGKFVIKTRLGYLKYNFDAEQNVSTAVYYFSDELGRFLNEPITCYKIKPGEKVPIELLEEGQIEEAFNLYRKIRQENPSDISVFENRFNSLGYNYMGKGMLNEAIAILKLNVEFYPESANTYDSLAEAYMNNGDNELAIINYKKSLELNPNNSNAVERLKLLKEQNEN
jgi:tetratricopeptide (TPR) repeat protein